MLFPLILSLFILSPRWFQLWESTRLALVGFGQAGILLQNPLVHFFGLKGAPGSLSCIVPDLAPYAPIFPGVSQDLTGVWYLETKVWVLGVIKYRDI